MQIRKKDFLPPPAPTENLKEAALLYPVFTEYPMVLYSEMSLKAPRLKQRQVIAGLDGMFRDYFRSLKDPAVLERIGTAQRACAQLVSVSYSVLGGTLTEHEADNITQLAFASLYEALRGLPAGLACALTMEAEEAHEASLMIDNARLPHHMAISERLLLSTANIPAPTRYTLPTDSISRNLARLLPDENEVFVGNSSVGGKPRHGISSVVTMDFPAPIQVDDGRYLSSYDKAILNGVSSLLLSGTMYFTIPMLFRAMTGLSNPSMGESAVENIRSRLEYMRRTTIRIDYTDEVAAHFIQKNQDVQKFVISQYLLPMSKMDAVLNGRNVEAYYLIDTPPLLQYASSKRQISLVDLQLLNAPLNNNIGNIVLKNYILSRIEGMKNHNNNIQSHKILFRSIYEELGEPEPSKLRRTRLRGYTDVFLKYLAEQNYIAGYAFTRSGRSIDGVCIELNSHNQTLAPEIHSLSPADKLPSPSGKIKPRPRKRNKILE